MSEVFLTEIYHLRKIFYPTDNQLGAQLRRYLNLEFPIMSTATDLRDPFTSRKARGVVASDTQILIPSPGFSSLSTMSPPDPLIGQLGQLDRSSPQFSDQLATLFGGEGTREAVLNLSAQAALRLTEYLDDVRRDNSKLNRSLKQE